MTEFAHSVNFTMSFGVNVLPEDINNVREMLKAGDCGTAFMAYNMSLTKDSTDEEISNYIGVENYRDWFLTECVDMEMEEHHVYDAKDTKRLAEEYKYKLESYRKHNRKR